MCLFPHGKYLSINLHAETKKWLTEVVELSSRALFCAKRALSETQCNFRQIVRF